MNLPPHQRYQSKPFIGSSHWWAQRGISQLGQDTSALDIGSGSGVMGLALKAQGIDERYAVELSAEARAETSHLYIQICSSFVELNRKDFSLALMLDVLEHLSSPEDLLRELLPLLSPGATALISVPNVAHWSVRIPLLFGCFNYTERGILDRTHQRFFTRRTLRKMLSNFPQLTIESEAVSIPPIEFVLPRLIWDNPVFRVLNRIRYACAQIFPGLFGYQLLTVVRMQKGAK